ncbi:MAG: tetratricopeptide repeat protein [Deltaproteobacteria bacterium]|nr:tetratricopeptide repeat protein [Deltaproteobacteria bacterium]
MNGRVAGVACGVALALALARPAPGDGRVRKAQALAQSAEVLADDGSLDEAIRLYERAYALDPEPVLLYNVARLHERKGDLDRAREGYERYLAAEKDAGGRAAGEARLATVRERIAAAAPTQPEPTQPEPTPPQAAAPGPPQAPVVETGRAAQVTASPPVPGRTAARGSAVARAPRKPVRGARWAWGWALVGTGAAAVAAGGVLTGLAAADRSGIDDAHRYRDGTVGGIGRAEALDLRAAYETKTKASVAMYAIGGAAVVTGAALLLVPERRLPAGPPPLSIAPLPGGGVAAAAVARF